MSQKYQIGEEVYSILPSFQKLVIVNYRQEVTIGVWQSWRINPTVPNRFHLCVFCKFFLNCSGRQKYILFHLNLDGKAVIRFDVRIQAVGRQVSQVKSVELWIIWTVHLCMFDVTMQP